MLRTRVGFIEPCLPSPADKPPAGANCTMAIASWRAAILLASAC
jgi:hypothetical protein